jgi:DNA-binding transcriptional LysR family regulator
MDFRHIRAFIAVADTLSVTKAAERLHISQPPLTRHIHQLEDELGLTLFVRHRHGVTLTDPGRILLEKARALDATAFDFYATAHELASSETNRIRIGIGWGLWDAVNRIRVEFARENPQITIEARDALCSDQYGDQLRNHTLDIAVGRPPFDTPGVHSVRIYKEPIHVAVGADSPLASRTTLSIRDLAGETLLLCDRQIQPVLYDKAFELCAAAGQMPTTVATPGAGPFNPAGLMLVASGRGVYLCLGGPPAAGVAFLPLDDPDATIDVCVVCRKDEGSSVVKQFLECVWKVFPGHGPALAPARVDRRRHESYDARVMERG